MCPDLQTVSHETVYRAVYIIPHGNLRKNLVGFLRQANSTRDARARGTNRCGTLVGMVSIHKRQKTSVDRFIPSDRERDFVKGA
jgi:transposase, IS30 family